MGWLRFNLPPEEELAVEVEARKIRDCSDMAQLRHLAEQAFRAWAIQVDITTQLLSQLAEAEAMLGQAGIIEQPEQQYLDWARELCPQMPPG